MRYVDNSRDSNLVINLMFFWANLEEFNTHIISLNLQSPSDYTSLSVNIIIKEFMKKLKSKVGYIDIFFILGCKTVI